MNAWVVYDSTSGNTEQVARAIASILEEQGVVKLTLAEQAGASGFAGVDLLVVGGPAQVRGLSPVAKTWLKSLPRGALRR